MRGQTRKFDLDEWESSEEEKRQVKSVKEKLQEQLAESVNALTEVLEISDTLKEVDDDVDRSKWPVVPNYTEVLEVLMQGLALLDKYKTAISKDGVPGFYIRTLVGFLDLVNQTLALCKSDATFKNCIHKDNLRALEKVGRFAKSNIEGDKRFASLIAEFRKDPKSDRWLDPLAKELKEESIDDDDGEVVSKPTQATGPKRGTREYWVKQPGHKDSSSEEEDDASWMNESDSGEDKEKKDRKVKPGAKSKKHKGKTATKAAEEGDGEDEEESSEDNFLGRSTAATEPMEEERMLKTEDVDRLTEEIAQLRGRKGTDYKRLLQRLEILLPKAFTDTQRITILLLLVNSRFDSVRTTKARLSAEHWRAAVKEIAQVLAILRANPNYRLVETDFNLSVVEEAEPEERIGGPVVIDEETKKRKQEKKRAKNEQTMQDKKAAGNQIIAGSLFALLDRLDNAFIRTLQQIDPHTQEYVTRLGDDPSFVALAKDMLEYQTSIADYNNASKTAHRIISHLYFRCYESATAADGTSTTRKVDYTEQLQKYSAIIYTHGGARRRAQAMLMCIYHFALQDNFAEARDRMLISHLQDKASVMDIETQVLFNRTNVQIGLCAFRNGLIREAHSALSEIYAGGRVKELLAQGTSSQRYQDKDKEQEKVEKARMMPFHMHINLELLETSHLIAAMMLEVPAMAAERYSRGGLSDDRGRVMSKYLRRLLDLHERQVFAGPPETTRDFVVAAARALSRGNWRKTSKLLLGMPAWDLLEDATKVKQMLSQQIQEVGLKTYLFTYCSCFETLSIAMLAEASGGGWMFLFFFSFFLPNHMSIVYLSFFFVMNCLFF